MKLFVTTPLLILAAPFLATGVGLLFLVLIIKPPASIADRMIDRIIDGSRA